MKQPKLYQDEKYLRHLYYDLKMLPSEIAKLFSVSPSLIHYYFRKFSIEYDRSINCIKYRKYHCDHHYFDTIKTANQAYWLGFIMADGSIEIHKNRTRTYRFILKLAKCDKAHIEKLNTELQSNYPIVDTINHTRGKDNPCSQVRISSSILCEGLMQNGVIPRKSCKETFPKNCIPQEYWKDFIRGVFDGDGCFSWFFDQDRHIPSCSFSLCGSQQMLFDCFSYINQCTGVNIPKITKRPSNDLYTATIGGNFNVLKIMNWLYANSDRQNRLDRKYDKYHEFLEEYNHPKYDEYKRKSNVYT